MSEPVKILLIFFLVLMGLLLFVGLLDYVYTFILNLFTGLTLDLPDSKPTP